MGTVPVWSFQLIVHAELCLAYLHHSYSTIRDWYAEQNSAELNGGRKPLL